MVEMEAGTKCGSCRREFLDGDHFCPSCGEQRAVGVIKQLPEETDQSDDEEYPPMTKVSSQGSQRGPCRQGSNMDKRCEETNDRGDRERALTAENQELIETVSELERMCAELQRQQRDGKIERDSSGPVADSEACSQSPPHSNAEGNPLLKVQGVFRDMLHKNRLLERDEAVQKLQREMDQVQGKYQHAKDEVAKLQARDRDRAGRAKEKDEELRGARGALDAAKEALSSERSICRQKTAEVGRLKEEMESLMVAGRAGDPCNTGRSGAWHEGRSSIGTCKSLAAELEGLDLSSRASEADADADELAHLRSSLVQAESEVAELRVRQQQLLAELSAAQGPSVSGAAETEELRACAGGSGAEVAEKERLQQELSRLTAEAEESRVRASSLEAEAADKQRLQLELSRVTAEAEESRADKEGLQQEVSRLRAEAEESRARMASLESEVSKKERLQQEESRARDSVSEAGIAEAERLQQELIRSAAQSEESRARVAALEAEAPEKERLRHEISRLTAEVEESRARVAVLEAAATEKERLRHELTGSADDAEGAGPQRPPADDEPEIIGTRKQELQELRRDVERLTKELAARGAGGDGRQGRAKEHQELLGRVVELQRGLALANKQAHEWKLKANQPWYESIVSFSSCVSKKPSDAAEAAPPPPDFASFARAPPEGGGVPAGTVAGQRAAPRVESAGQPAMVREDRL